MGNRVRKFDIEHNLCLDDGRASLGVEAADTKHVAEFKVRDSPAFLMKAVVRTPQAVLVEGLQHLLQTYRQVAIPPNLEVHIGKHAQFGEKVARFHA